MNNYNICNDNGKIKQQEGLAISDFVNYLGALDKLSLSNEEKNELMMNRCVFKIDNKFIKESTIETDSNMKIQAGDATFYVLDKGDVLTIKTSTDQLSIGVKQDSSLLISKEDIVADTIRMHLQSEVDQFPKDSIEYQAMNWLENGERGLSSLSLCYHLCGDTIKKKIEEMENKKTFTDHPHDGADFGRCHKFFNLVPLAKTSLSSMSLVSNEWAELTKIWDDLDSTYVKAIQSKEDATEINKLIRGAIYKDKPSIKF